MVIRGQYGIEDRVPDAVHGTASSIVHAPVLTTTPETATLPFTTLPFPRIHYALATDPGSPDQANVPHLWLVCA